MVTDSQRVGHNRKRWVDCIAGWEKSAVHHVKVFKFVCFAVGVEHRCLRIVAKARCPALVSYAAKRDLAGFLKMQSCMPLAQQVLQLHDQPTIDRKSTRLNSSHIPLS